jgi:hypothetical protein
MFENDIYKIDREFDYATVEAIVLESLLKIAKELAFKNYVIPDYGCIENNAESSLSIFVPSFVEYGDALSKA